MILKNWWFIKEDMAVGRRQPERYSPISLPEQEEGEMTALSVLIVDDKIEFAAALLERLLARGLKAEAVHSGKEALSSVITNPPDVVILDLKLPDLNPLEVLEAIKTFDPAIEIIILTDHETATMAIEGMEHGAFDYFIKPIDFDLLLEKIYLSSGQNKEIRSRLM
ncbi:MAG: response regulator [Proteobacteria bacterium]|nr:response regulator [Pseudomonadota bacterium]